MTSAPEQSLKIPDGFTQMRPYGGFHESNGPFWMAKRGENSVVGFRVEESHGNAVGGLHGGMLATLVDTVLTLAAAKAAPKGQFAVTSSLTCDFLAPGKFGDWIEAEAEVLRVGRSLIHLDCRVRRDGPDGDLLMRASAGFHIVTPR